MYVLVRRECLSSFDIGRFSSVKDSYALGFICATTPNFLYWTTNTYDPVLTKIFTWTSTEISRLIPLIVAFVSDYKNIKKQKTKNRETLKWIGPAAVTMHNISTRDTQTNSLRITKKQGKVETNASTAEENHTDQSLAMFLYHETPRNTATWPCETPFRTFLSTYSLKTSIVVSLSPC